MESTGFVLLGLALIALSCATQPGEDPTVVEEHFTGITYSAWQGDLPSPGRHGPVWLVGVGVAQHVTWRHMDAYYEPFPGDGPRNEALAEVIPATTATWIIFSEE